jgi:23S rRNA (uracil1939-C5)-methyltransferase
MSSVREVHAVSGPPVVASFGREQIGEGPARVKVKDWVFDLHPLAFFQSNRYLLDDFIETVLKHCSGAKRVLDLFCGSGFFSIPLAAQGTQVLGVETSRFAVKQARTNARLNGVSDVEFFESAVEESLRDSPDVRPDLILLNPPRAGAGREVAKRVAGLKAERIVYVSCNPSTLGREAAVLSAEGYALRSLTLIDQFPNTYHIETLALFERT